MRISDWSSDVCSSDLSTIKTAADIQKAWDYSQAGGRTGRGRVIIEGFVDFDYEITMLTVRHAAGISFCPPVGHLQADGDYRESWQPQAMSERARQRAETIAAKVVDALCGEHGRGMFGAEFFIRGDEAVFSELSPPPHDTGLVTLISQDLSQFALHARAILDLPIHNLRTRGPASSAARRVGKEVVRTVRSRWSSDN